MHFEGQQTIHTSIQNVWAFFMDPNRVAECAPGFKSMEILGPDHFKPTLAVGIGPVRTTFTLDVRLSDLHEPDHAVMTAHGKAAGSAAEVRAEMHLTSPNEQTTEMAWTSDVTVNGTLASVGGRLMESAANKLTRQFFDCTRAKLEQ